jgi:hypothetical protein
MEVINLSSGGFAYPTMKPLIQRAIERAPHVELVVIELDIFLLRGHGLIQDRLFELQLPMRDWPVGYKKRIRHILEYGGPLCAMPRVDVEYFTQSIRQKGRLPAGSNGYNPFPSFRDLSAEESDELYGAARYLWLHRGELVVPLEEANTQILIELLHWLEDHNIRWALVTLPHLPGWINGRPAEWTAAVDNSIKTIRNEYHDTAIRYWDASSSLGLDKPDFNDGLHLNRRGVERYSHALNQKILTWLADDVSPAKFSGAVSNNPSMSMP